MHAVVCIKQVPDTTEVRIDPKTGTLDRRGVPNIVNPEDLHALEAALEFRDRFGGRVTVLTMGPNFAASALRECLALGADEGVLLTDRRFAAADTFATTYALWSAIQKIEKERGPVDVVLTGRYALDGDTGQVGPGLARRLRVPLLSYVTAIEEVDFEAKRIVVQRHIEGAVVTLESRLPAVLTCSADLNQVRYASLPALLAAQQAQVTAWSVDDVGADPEQCGLKGSPTIVSKSFVPEPRTDTCRLFEGEPAEAAASLVDFLIAEHRIPGFEPVGAKEA
ncbi:MAG: electron transfer flavoprotein subunit beta/FixA family protein [Bacillota bacterium]|nr:electron transfer flavoprotein subunit beta/FixA family protein [Bacillota bacterium]MDI3317396.1 electron transfer flavoprotein subunit beta/FixA family protein [Bacillota bacterium]